MPLRVRCHRQDLFLGKAIELGLKPIVVVNKVDKENCTPDIVQEAIFDLMFNLDAVKISWILLLSLVLPKKVG